MVIKLVFKQQENIFEDQKYNNVLDSMKSSWKFIILIFILSFVSFLGIMAYIEQLEKGLIVTGLGDRNFWGLYVSNFVFFIGISHAGTLISAILRVTGAEWRTPITRMAEAITVFSLIVGAAMVLIDMGRVDRILNVIIYMNINSPIIWDFFAIGTYLTGSILFLYLPLIPDIALLRDKYKEKGGIRFHFYRIFALRWSGTETQRKKLERGISIMAILIIPIAISVHTVVSFIFSMTWRPGWHSSIFGPYFVVGAIFSGIAALLLAMAVFRKYYKLHDLITEKQFKNLGLLLLSFAFLYFYFTVAEFLTAGYTNWKEEADLLRELFYGQFAIFFWIFLVLGLLIPIFILIYPKTRTIKGIVIASILINIGMWVKRFIIVVPTVSAPVISENWIVYIPTDNEIWITLGGFAFFMLLYAIFSKIFPIISIWEVKEQEDRTKKEISTEKLISKEFDGWTDSDEPPKKWID
ncbi:MAG: hypothetical protein HeimC3_07260 [Candidatus Heimdallarchaeota archaeon LC_3]|nr:MAG: hypothetical protein HeimC3_07260 [Candidatus Heimdallarchaeota archaeon LC_3]